VARIQRAFRRGLGFEIGCGLLVLVGLTTRLVAIPLIIDMLVAIATTKIPMLFKSGFWSTAHEARADWSMLQCRGPRCVYFAADRSTRGRSPTRRGRNPMLLQALVIVNATHRLALRPTLPAQAAFPSSLSPTDRSARLPFGDQFLVRG
jgi:DoxX